MFNEEIPQPYEMLALQQQVVFQAGQKAEREAILDTLYDLMPEASANQCDALLTAIERIKERG